MMKKFFSQLRPLERRLVVGVLVVLILVLNYVYIWPHFSDWSNLRKRLDDARNTLVLYQNAILDTPKFQGLVSKLQNQGEFVPGPDQAVNFLRTIQDQANASQVQIGNISPASTQTNDFFVEQSRVINVSGDDKALVDFLYKLGASASMIRVRQLELQPDGTHMRLNANIHLVASYQRNAPAASAASNAKPK
jgi:type II secretory pathway component PulM